MDQIQKDPLSGMMKMATIVAKVQSWSENGFTAFNDPAVVNDKSSIGGV